MANTVRPSSLISISLSLLEKQEKEYEIVMDSEPLKDHVLSLKLGLRSLETFDDVSSNEALTRRIKHVCYDVRRKLHSLSSRPINESLIQYLDNAYSNLREKMKNVIINPETGECDVIFPKFFKGETYVPKFFRRNNDFKRIYDFILKSFGDLSTLKAHLIAPSIKEKLVFLQSFLKYVADTGVDITKKNKKILTPLVALLDKAACILFFCLVCKMDEEMELAVKKNLSHLFEKNNFKEIYIAVFRDSKFLFQHKILKLFGLNKKLLEIEFHFLHNLIKLLDLTSNFVIYTNGVCETLHDKLKFLRTFLIDLPYDVKLEKATYLVPSIKAITSTALHILSSCYDKYMKVEDVTEMSGPIAEVIDQIEDIQEKVEEIILHAEVIYLIEDVQEKVEENILHAEVIDQIEDVQEKVEENILHAEVIDQIEDVQEKVEENILHAEVIDQIGDIQEDDEEIILYNYPKTDTLGFLDLFLGHVEELLKHRPELIKILKSQIETLKDEFESLRSFLKKIKEHEHEEVKDLWTRIIHLAYQAEFVIDCYLVKSSSDRRIKLTLSKIIQKIKLIQLEVTRINNTKKYVTQADIVAKTSNKVPSHATDTRTDEVVGLEDEVEKIMEYLLGGQKQLDVISIAGMPGLGKTTLARKIYQDSSVLDPFDVRAWCTVSQTYRNREVLLTILGHIITVTDEISKLDDQELVERLCKSLRGRRYLIVIDDLWDIMAWNDLKRSFPIENYHSRILITTRLQDVASKIKVSGKVHNLRPLCDDETWKLLKKKLFQKESYSEAFLEVGKRIAKNCKGLPLAIVVTAGLLGKVEKSIHEWNKIAGSLNSHIFSDSETQCKAILELSYNHLPDHLKSCFLYFGTFAEDEEIFVKKLKWLWISEGFVRNTNSLEDVAEEYFMDLLNRSLVTVNIESSLGRVKTCRVHDLIHNFCLVKSQEDSFMQVIRVDDESKFPSMYDQRRLKIYSTSKYPLRDTPTGLTVRSLLHTSLEDSSFARCPVLNDSFGIWSFKLLRVLDLTSVNIYWKQIRQILLLIHLRYLAIRDSENSIPSSISNLWNLQFFIVKANQFSSYKGVDVPDSVWDMVNLRHVHIENFPSFALPFKRIENLSLYNLESLSTPSLCYGRRADNFLKRLPKLRKLRCIFQECWNDSLECYLFPIMGFLDQLISLKVYFKVVAESKRCVFNFPPNLQKLTLSKFGVLGNNISEIGRSLPNLRVLKLIGSHRKWEWIVNNGDFPKLKYLKLCGIYYTSNWTASDNSFPILEQLVLDSVWGFREIPRCFEEIPTLRMITLTNCRKSLDDSARRIEMEQHEELQNLDLKVYINSSKESEEV